MAKKLRKIFFLTIFFHFVVKPPTLSKGQQQVPCIFFMGDSLIDNGNNNNLLTFSKANYSPYGIDYPNGPTGRFSNGENMADFLGMFPSHSTSMCTSS